jgi:hypothetical protein
MRDVELPQTMQRDMARQAEAEREKRAKIIHAEGEFQASQQLGEAAEVISRNPVTIQLRYLQTLNEIGAEKNTTVVFPLPIEMLGAIVGAANAIAGNPTPQPAHSPAPAPASGQVPTTLRPVPSPQAEPLVPPVPEPSIPPEQ